ncbi:CoB--CoM heterodisulfide reductase iron-sulfur subunit A family protein [Bacteroidota bacterium]
MEKPRIGVYVCWCGNNIAKMVDVVNVAQELKELPNVVISKDYKYMCSDPGQDLIINDIKDFKLNRIVVSACSPRIHENTFRNTLKKAGLNPYMVQMANIREHASWVHTDKPITTKKAKALVTAAINRINYHVPLDERLVDINPATLVIGAGISGMTAALEIADAGKKVYLIENSDKPGGVTANVDLTFPYFNSAKGKVDSLIKRVNENENIELFTETEVDNVTGYIGNFETILSLKNEKEAKLTFGNIIIAIGLKPWDPTPMKNYGYGKLPDVITSVEFEKMLLSGNITKKDGSIPKNIAIIHCVGSRNKDYHKYCSRTCCTTALKYANQLRSVFPESNIYELYADMRSMSKGCEELYAQTSKKKIMFMMFDQENDLPVIRKAEAKDNCEMIIELNEQKTRKSVEIPADMVILMTSVEAQDTAKKISHSAGISLCSDIFFIEKHPKLDPVATTTGGVYIVGACQGPKGIPDSVSQSMAASARILGVINKGKASVEVTTAYVENFRCCACKMCISCCPYTAIGFDEEKNVSVVNEVLCQGCGTCVALCRPKAINIKGCSHEQMTAEINALLLSD